jgi:hypothetical protein
LTRKLGQSPIPIGTLALELLYCLPDKAKGHGRLGTLGKIDMKCAKMYQLNQSAYAIFAGYETGNGLIASNSVNHAMAYILKRNEAMKTGLTLLTVMVLAWGYFSVYGAEEALAQAAGNDNLSATADSGAQVAGSGMMMGMGRGRGGQGMGMGRGNGPAWRGGRGPDGAPGMGMGGGGGNGWRGGRGPGGGPGMGEGRGKGFIDADNNGICDNCPLN